MTDRDKPENDGLSASSVAATRGIAALLVVLVHVNLLIRPAVAGWWPGGFWFAPLFGLPVPLFFLLSGYSAGTGPARGQRPLWPRLQRLVLPFCSWNCILLVIGGSTLLSPSERLFSFLTGTWQLYFLFVLLQLQLLLHLLQRGGITPAPRRLFLFSALLTLIFFVATDLTLWTKGAQAGFSETYLIKTIMPWALFYSGGVLIRQEPERITNMAKRFRLLVLVTSASYGCYVVELQQEAAWLGYNPLLQFLLSGLFFQVSGVVLILLLMQQHTSRSTAHPCHRLLAVLGKEAYAIYLAHTAILLLLLATYNHAPCQLPFALEPPLMWLAAFLGSWGLVKACRHLPSRWPGLLLFGIRMGGKRSAGR